MLCKGTILAKKIVSDTNSLEQFANGPEVDEFT